jgi:hypothetical protein
MVLGRHFVFLPRGLCLVEGVGGCYPLASLSLIARKLQLSYAGQIWVIGGVHGATIYVTHQDSVVKKWGLKVFPTLC